MTNQVNEVLEKVRDICDLKKLEFGCWVERFGRVYHVVSHQTFGDVMTTYKCVDVHGDSHYVTKDEVEIIGLPVQPEHLLLALGSRYAITGKGGIWHYVNSNWEIVNLSLSIDLQKTVEDNLQSNPELTLFIHNQICV